MSDSALPPRSRALPPALAAGLRVFILLALPVVLALTGVRLVMTETFVRLEYHRPGFPDDRFGFTQQDRLRYAPYAVRYLLNDAGIDYLGRLELDGIPLYTVKELQHMQDVKTVTRAAMTIYAVAGLGLALSVIALLWRRRTWHDLAQGLFAGGALTLALILTLVVLIFASWDVFFTGFHHLFFKGDSWQFSTDSTLIRLFPERFWFDAAISIGALTVIGALLAVGIGWWLEGRALRDVTPAQPPGAG